MTGHPLTIAEQIDLHFPALRNKSRRIAKLESKLEAKRAQKRLIYDHAREAASRVDVEVGSINRQIKLEESLVRRRIARALESGRDPMTGFPKKKHINPIEGIIQEVKRENQTG